MPYWLEPTTFCLWSYKDMKHSLGVVLHCPILTIEDDSPDKWLNARKRLVTNPHAATIVLSNEMQRLSDAMLLNLFNGLVLSGDDFSDELMACFAEESWQSWMISILTGVFERLANQLPNIDGICAGRVAEALANGADMHPDGILYGWTT